jgi:hypothetical protein
VSPAARARAADVAVAATFSAVAATLFVLGDDRDGSLPFFLAWLAVHVLYGLASGTFWALAIVVVCPPLFVASSSGDGDGTPLWLQAAFVEAFYGVPFAFMGVIAHRLWKARRGLREDAPKLPPPDGREDGSE